MTTKEKTQMKKKILNKSSVYRAIYYSGFEWTSTKLIDQVNYTLTSKDSGVKIYLNHLNQDGEHDTITIKANETLNEKDSTRLLRLCKKIYRRTKNLLIEQDLVDIAKSIPDNNPPTEEVPCND